jgi:hypothetical protein
MDVMATILAAVEEGGQSFILFTVMLVIVFLAHKFTIPR